MQDNIQPIKGILEFTTRCKLTGEVLDHEKDNNAFLRFGMSEMLRAFTNAAPTGGALTNVIQFLRIGDDVGSGTQMNPTPAQSTYTKDNQNVIHSIPYSDLVVNYPNYYSVEINAVLDGDDIMANSDDVDQRFTSATLCTGDGTAVAFRRFQARTITRQVVIDVKWVLKFDGQG